MTETLFHKQPNTKETEAKVMDIDGKRVLCDKTIFFPQTSTEPGDSGKINGIKVIGLKKEDENIWHILKREPEFSVGDTVKLELDWNRRHKMMRRHSALHLLAGVFEIQAKVRAVAGVVKTDSLYLVFKQPLEKAVIENCLQKANQVISEGAEVTTYEDKERKGFRWCKVNDFIPIPCGGVHIANTKEIGEVNFLREEREDTKQKIFMEVK